MKASNLIPALAVLGVGVTLAAIVFDGQGEATSTTASVDFPNVPYAAYVAGPGVVESQSGDIAVGSPVAGIVTAVRVTWGALVDAGTPLFELDKRDLEAQLLPASAKVQEARAAADQATGMLELAEQVPDHRAVSAEEMKTRRAHVAMTVAAVASAQAEVDRLRKEMALRTVLAPATGKVLQINIHPGEAVTSVGGTPLLLLGDVRRLWVRASIDQNDAWRVQPGAKATAFLRGNPRISMPLHFEHIEPAIVPRAVVTGDSTERVDSRVLQVVYSFDPARLPVYVGQWMDVYIEAPALPGDKAAESRR
ncbi:efflux RND transporter periplasmic adaptor subunit [Dyella sp. Tek66A03]|uniref:efflux RND transporter periplasmic adaptor subunit n=1 Tax=Dyella sp. Tek66A03 TaxID=3458298 RepID=UPI00403E7BE7